MPKERRRNSVHIKFEPDEEPLSAAGDDHWPLVQSLNAIDNRMAMLSDQFKSLSEELALQKDLINQLLRGRVSVSGTDLEKKFPIRSKDALIQMNEDIEMGDRNSYINLMRKLLLQGVKKNFKYIIADEVTMQYNVDGVLGKDSLKNLTHFYSVVIDSIETEGVGSAEDKLRSAMKLQKNRVIKSHSKHKQKELYKAFK